MSEHQRQVASLTLHEHLEDLVRAAQEAELPNARLCVELTAEGTYVKAVASPHGCAAFGPEQSIQDHVFIELAGAVGPYTASQDIAVAIQAWETPPPAEVGDLQP
jgi:hypothetical protein